MRGLSGWRKLVFSILLAGAGGCGFTILDPVPSFVALSIDVTSADLIEASVRVAGSMSVEDEALADPTMRLGALAIVLSPDLTFDTTFLGENVQVARNALTRGEWVLPVVSGLIPPVTEGHEIITRRGPSNLPWQEGESLVVRFNGIVPDDLSWSLAFWSSTNGTPTVWGRVRGTGPLTDSLVVDPSLFRCNVNQPRASLATNRVWQADNVSGEYAITLRLTSRIDWDLEVSQCQASA